VQLTANLAQLLAPSLAAASCAWAAATGSGRSRRAWALLAGSAGSWAVGQATWVWYEHLARRELPFPSLADIGYLLAIPLAAAAMLAFPGRAERAALQARSVLDGAVIASSLLYTSWALVLGPVFRAGEGSVLSRPSPWPTRPATSSWSPSCSWRWPGSGSAAPRCCCSGPVCSAWPWPTPASPT
jgi:hypothetical protein